METLRIESSHGKTLVGILRPSKTPQKLNDPRAKPNLAIICHDLLGHKNQAFLPLLADNLPFDTFRFDFHGNGESDGETHFANFEEETDDLFEVVHYFQNQGYHIHALIGYGKSTAVILKYATFLNRAVPHIVSISPRYNMSEIWDLFQGPDLASLNSGGHVNLTSKGYDGKDVTLKVMKQDVEAYANWDMAFVAQLTITTSVLTCHGLADTSYKSAYPLTASTPPTQRTPVQNAALFANNIPTHTLQLLPSADHTFSNPQHAAQLVDAVVRYFSREGERERSWRNGTGRSIQIPRWISVDGYRNFRDLGGWPVKGWDGSTVGYVRERLIFRGGE
ncbi:Alpha/Beta hydrolase protein [Endogone sp. FLAS-F59071]|nr:Alpha/Beta hydrolase protein [Endogone sp. FLAS-F59071]|eukprot:RUS17429.1 Alpha/Beta hydrolase protein [Endogone sp. FLAS-F59071]